MVEISASLLAADFARLGSEVRRAERAGADSFHFDMMDGHYVPNLALTPQHLSALRPYSRLPFHVHLELSEPDGLLEAFAPLGADVIVVQWDTLVHPERTFERIRSQGARVGLALNPEVPLADVQPVLPAVDELLLLGVNPGFGGQRMQLGTLAKVAEARDRLRVLGLALPIAVDGGVKPENAAALVQAGADCLIMGTGLFAARDMAATIARVRGRSAPLPHR